MEHRSDAEIGPEVLRIGRDREQGVGRCSKQDAIDDRLVLISDIGNLLWQRKHHMEIRDRKQIGLACGKPFPRRCALALRAVPITAGNGELTITCLMGKFRNGELAIDSVVKLTCFRGIGPDQSTLYSPLGRLTAELREAGGRAVDDSTHFEGVAADWMQEIFQPLNLHAS